MTCQADFVIGEEAARQEGMAAVVDGQIFQGRAAAARDEEDELCAVALPGGIVGPLEPHRSAKESRATIFGYCSE
jgi:hypothetical protein